MRWVALGLTLMAIGCAASERAPDAAGVAEDFQAALEAGEGGTACEQLSEETALKGARV